MVTSFPTTNIWYDRIDKIKIRCGMNFQLISLWDLDSWRHDFVSHPGVEYGCQETQAITGMSEIPTYSGNSAVSVELPDIAFQ